MAERQRHGSQERIVEYIGGPDQSPRIRRWRCSCGPEPLAAGSRAPRRLARRKRAGGRKSLEAVVHAKRWPREVGPGRSRQQTHKRWTQKHDGHGSRPRDSGLPSANMAARGTWRRPSLNICQATTNPSNCPVRCSTSATPLLSWRSGIGHVSPPIWPGEFVPGREWNRVSRPDHARGAVVEPPRPV